METNYYLKYPHLMDNGNANDKYGPVGVLGYLQVDYVKLFKNGRWPDLSDIPVPELNTVPAQGTHINGNPPRYDGRKCYECGGNNL